MDPQTRRLVEASQEGMLQRQLYLVRHDPAVPLGEMIPLLHEHHEYVAELDRSGVLLAAGPLLDDAGEPGGASLWILEAASAEEATELAAADPLCRARQRTPTVRSWRLNVGSLARAAPEDGEGSR